MMVLKMTEREMLSVTATMTVMVLGVKKALWLVGMRTHQK